MNKFTVAMLIPATAFWMGCSVPGASPGSSISCGEERLCQTNQAIEINSDGVTAQSVSAQGLLDPVLSLTPVLTLVGTLASPVLNSVKLQASDITVNGTKVYVAYNLSGDTQAGAIDVIDISTPGTPLLKSEAIYPTADIHKVTVNGTNLYAVGATSAGNEGAMLYRIGLDANGLLTSTKTEKSLRRAADLNPAYAGVSVKVSTNYVYAASGSNGGVQILNKADLSDAAFTAIENVRDLAISPANGDAYVVTGKTGSEEAKIKRLNGTTGALDVSTNITLPGAQLDQGKSTIQTGSSFHIATAGFGGARMVCTDSAGSLIGTMANPGVAGLGPALQTANAAAFGNGIVYVANGEAGVSLYTVERTLITIGCVGYYLEYRGRFGVGTGVSANNVFWTNGHLVVATGSGGFKIIQVTQSLVAGLLQVL